MEHDTEIIVKGEPFVIMSIHRDDLAAAMKPLWQCSKFHYDATCRSLSDEADATKGLLNGIITILTSDCIISELEDSNVIVRSLKLRDIDLMLKCAEIRYMMTVSSVNFDIESLNDFVALLGVMLRSINKYVAIDNGIRSVIAGIPKD